jgi:signal transduction histidine kinase
MDTIAWEMLQGPFWAAAGLEPLGKDLTTPRQVNADLEDRVRFEAWLADLSTSIRNGPDDAVPIYIQAGLQRVVHFLGIDCSTLLEFSGDRTNLHAIQSYAVPGTIPALSQGLDHLPWSTQTLRHGQIIRFARLDELPAEAWAEKESCRRAGCQSGMTIPLVVEGEVRYAMSFRSFRAERPWPAELIPRLRLVGEIFANAISRRRSMEATHRLQQELAHVTRIAMLGELAATLAHELSRPLAAILSNAQAAHRFLTMPSPQLDEVQDGLADIIAETRRLAELLQRLRALAKKTDGKRTAFDVNEMIGEIIHLVGAEANARQVHVIRQLQDDLPQMYGDRIQLQQVVLNFVLNAFDAIAATTDQPREIVVRTRLEPAQSISVAVEDSGIGLEPEALERLFEPFFTTKAEGLGMGLAISRSIILAHRGRIWATPHPGRGTTMSFSIPTDEQETA